MSTRLLDRRMDLIHTYDDNKRVNYLTMDTSYPVVLSGIIVKVFKATTYYNCDTLLPNNTAFIIENENHKEILSIPRQNIYDFANNSYPLNEEDKYAENDYVLTIIDFGDETRKNGKLLIHTLHSNNVKEKNDIYTRYLAYYCNGYNDNKVLGDIINTLIDLYDCKEDINYDQDELQYSITNYRKNIIYQNRKFTIDIIGNFGIDYSETVFTYGGFNRQNRSSIMSIKGTNSNREIPIEEAQNKDFELILNFEKCTIPSIQYDSNEIYASIYNCKLDSSTNINGKSGDYINPWYIDTDGKHRFANTSLEFSKCDFEPHFKNINNKAYGNLFPRRLVFISIEGALPLNVTIENMCLTTFGVGIYCETETNKTIKIKDSKITMLNAFDKEWRDSPSVLDITSDKNFYLDYKFTIPIGSALDINSFNTKVLIDGCQFKNAPNVRTGDMIINSSKNMRISNSDILGLSQYNDGYKHSYTFQFLDFEYNPDCYFEIDNFNDSYVTYDNPNSSATPHALTDDQKSHINYLDRTILYKLFYLRYMYPNKRIIKYKDLTNKLGIGEDKFTNNYNDGTYNYLYGLLEPSDLLKNNNTKYSSYLFDCTDGNTKYAKIKFYNNIISLTRPVLTTVPNSAEHSSITSGIIKNVPILFRDSYFNIRSGSSKYGLIFNNKDSRQNPIQLLSEYHFNEELQYQPKIFINNTRIESDGLIYQAGGSIYLNNCDLKTKLYDYRYQSCQINIISGSVNINNCDIDFDTESNIKSKFGVISTNWTGNDSNGPCAFVRLSPNYSSSVLYNMNNIDQIEYDNNNHTYVVSSERIHDYDFFIWGNAVKSHTSPVLNMNNSNIITHVDPRFNVISHSYDSNNDNGYDKFMFTPDVSINSGHIRKFMRNTQNSAKISIIYSSNMFDNSAGNPSNYFNPITDPKVNISSTNFYIDNNFGRGEFSNLSSDYLNNGHYDKTNSDVLAILIKCGNTVINNINNLSKNDSSIYTGNIDDLYTLFNSSLIIKPEAKNKLNVIIKYGRTNKFNLESNKWLEDLNYDEVYIKYYDINSKMYYERYFNYDATNSKINVSNSESVLQYNDNVGIYDNLINFTNIKDNYEFFENINNIYNLNTNYTTSSDNNDTNKNEDLVIVTKIYPSDLPNTGLYCNIDLNGKMESLGNETTEITTLDETKYNVKHLIDNPAKNLLTGGVTAVQLCNSTLNMSDCTIGSVKNSIRNTYNGETFIKHSPRICFEFYGSGIYNISNTIAYAWNSILWSNLNSSIDSVFYRLKEEFNPGGICKIGAIRDLLDKSTLDMMKGQLVLDNCNFTNYNAIRYNESNNDKLSKAINKNTMNDYKRYYLQKDISNNKVLDAFKYSNLTNETKTNSITSSRTTTDLEYYNYYTESLINANEFPIIFINNSFETRTDINNSIIKGNHIYIGSGNINVRCSEILNNNNGLLFYLYKSITRLYNNNTWVITNTPCLKISDSKLISIKDVLSDKYINNKYKKHCYVNTKNKYIETTYFDDKSNKGSKLTDDNVVAIYGYLNNRIELDNNEIIMKCNSYHKSIGISDYYSIRFIFVNQKSNNEYPQDIILNSNTVDMMMDGGTTLQNLNSNFIRCIPTSHYYSFMEINNENNNKYKGKIKINNNDFNLCTLINASTDVKYIYGVYNHTIWENSNELLHSNTYFRSLDSLYPIKDNFDNNLTIDTINNTGIMPLNQYTNKRTYIENVGADYRYFINECEIKIDESVQSDSIKFIDDIICQNYSKLNGTVYNRYHNYKLPVILNDNSISLYDSLNKYEIKELSNVTNSNIDNLTNINIIFKRGKNTGVYNNSNATYSIDTTTVHVENFDNESYKSLSNSDNDIDLTIDNKYCLPVYIGRSTYSSGPLNKKYMLTGFNTPVLYIPYGYDSEDKTKQLFLNDDIDMTNNTFNNGGLYTGVEPYNNSSKYESYLKSNCITVNQMYNNTIQEQSYYILHSPCIFDVNYIVKYFKSDFSLNHKRLLENNEYYINAISNNNVSINISNNTFLGNRSQSYYYDGDLGKYYACTNYSKYFLLSVTDDIGFDSYGFIFKDSNKFNIRNTLHSTYDIEFTNDLNTVNSKDNIEQKYYKTKFNTGLNDQYNNGYTFTNSYAIRMNLRHKNTFLNYKEFYDMIQLRSSNNTGFSKNTNLYFGISENTTIYQEDGSNNFTKKDYDLSGLKDDGKAYSESEIYFKTVPDSVKIGNDNVLYVKITYSKTPTKNNSWTEVGYVRGLDLHLASSIYPDRSYSHLIEPINGIIGTNAYSQSEKFLYKTDNIQDLFIPNSNGSHYTPIILDYDGMPLNILIQNNRYMYDNMSSINKKDDDQRTLVYNKERCVKLLTDIYNLHY